MAQYKTGTVSVTNGSPTVTGQGTEWLSNVQAGNLFKIRGEPVIYVIASITSNTQLTLSTNYSGTTKTNQEYQITRDFTPTLQLAEIHAGDIDWATNLTLGTIRKIDEKLGEDATPKFKSVKLNIKTVTSNYTVTTSDYTVLVNASSGSVTISLPDATSCAGFITVIKKIDSSGNAVVIDPYSTQTIDGSTTISLTTQWSFRMVQSNGSNWYVIGS